MTREDLGAFVEEFQRTAEVYQRECGEGVIALYFDVLIAYPLADVMRALRAHIAHPDTGQFFPKPADLVRLIEGDTESRALQAWTRANHAAWEVGQYESVNLGDPVAHRVITDMGGWPEFCCWLDDDRKYRQKEFCVRYRVLVGRHTVDAPEHLVGLHELNNLGAFPQFIRPPVTVDARGVPRALPQPWPARALVASGPKAVTAGVGEEPSHE